MRLKRRREEPSSEEAVALGKLKTEEEEREEEEKGERVNSSALDFLRRLPGVDEEALGRIEELGCSVVDLVNKKQAELVPLLGSDEKVEEFLRFIHLKHV